MRMVVLGSVIFLGSAVLMPTPSEASLIKDGRESKSRTVATQVNEHFFPTVAELLMDLKARYWRRSLRGDKEHVGAIYFRPGYGYSASHGTGRTGQDRVSFRVPRLRDSQIVAYWHTHGAPGFARHLFSGHDAQLVVDTGLPFYLITPNGELRVLAPKDVSRRGPRRPVHSIASTLGYRGSAVTPHDTPRGAAQARVVAVTDTPETPVSRALAEDSPRGP